MKAETPLIFANLLDANQSHRFLDTARHLGNHSDPNGKVYYQIPNQQQIH